MHDDLYMYHIESVCTYEAVANRRPTCAMFASRIKNQATLKKMTFFLLPTCEISEHRFEKRLRNTVNNVDDAGKLQGWLYTSYSTTFMNSS